MRFSERIEYWLVVLFLVAHMSTGNAQEDRTNYEEIAPAVLNHARAGDANAMWVTSTLYRHGLGLPQNDRVAKRWLDASAEKNYPPALAESGQRHLFGEGEGVDIQRGLELLEKAHQLDYEPAAAALGAYYLGLYPVPNGEVIDAKKGAKYLRGAAVRKDADAQYYLALMLFNGKRPGASYVKNTDVSEALDYLEESADQANLRAILTLGNIYGHKNSPEYNIGKAFYWWSIARKLGVSEFDDQYFDAELSVSSATRRLIKQRVKDWFARLETSE